MAAFMPLEFPTSQISISPGYRPQSEDKTLEADAADFYLLRQLTNAQRWQMGAKLTRWAKAVSLRGMRKANTIEFPERFSRSILGDKWLPLLTPTSDPSMWIQDPSAIAKRLHTILTELDIPYYITGEVAAIAYGEPRTTRDLDLVIELDRQNVPKFVEKLEQGEFYCPPGAVADLQTGQGRTLSVTHMTQILNADIVVNGESEFDRSKMARRGLEALDEEGTEQFWLASPEDVILAKLLWRKQSGSQKQWNDVLGILKVQIETLDYGYLDRWAEKLAIQSDFDRALIEAGI
jgi:hypothetical protein